MKENKNIDRLFQEHFKDFEALPNPKLWLNIEAELKKDTKKRSILPFWFRYSGIAAAFFLGMFSLKMHQKIDFKNPHHNWVNTSEFNKNGNIQKEKKLMNFKFKEKNIASKSVIFQPTKKSEQRAAVLLSKTLMAVNKSNIQNFIKNEPEKQTIETADLATQNLNQKPKEEIVEKTTTPQIANAALVANDKTDTTNPLEDILKTKNQDKNKTLAAIKNKWEIAPNVAPVYLNSNLGSSTIDKQFANNPQTSDNTISYGLGIRYVLNQKLTVRTALNKLVLGYNTNQLSNASINAVNSIETIDLVENTNAQVSNNASSPAISQPILYDSTILTNTLNQKMGYYEWPLEIAYTILDKKIGISLIGGFSTLFLDENKISLVNSQENRVIGQANNLNQIHWSTNFGIGFRYQLIPSIQFHFEPLIKYQLNTFSKETTSFNPVFLGLYTGVNYRF